MKTVQNSSKASANTSFQPPLTLRMDDHVTFRLYQDTRPHCLEIAALQKGLVLVFDNNELIEEGGGFGFPVIKYSDKTYFSTSASSSLQRTHNGSVLIKSFNMDAISRKKIGKASYVNDVFYSFIHRIFEQNYLSHKRLAFLFNAIMVLRKLLKIDTAFVKAEYRGRVKIQYDIISPSELGIAVDLSQLEKENCEEILILNEQGSTFFREYVDNKGLSLRDNMIGAWDIIEAKEAALSDTEKRLTFSLQKVGETRFFRGREQTKGRFSWAGLSYSLSPTVDRFSYLIKLDDNLHARSQAENVT